MDSIKQAVELARAAEIAPRPATRPSSGLSEGSPVQARSMHRSEMFASMLRISKDLELLRMARQVEHGRYYDMLRTQVLQEMDKKSWQFLAVTSPTAGCGKSVTACNLAMSIARLPERSVLLVDLDLRKPMVANYLGIEEHWRCAQRAGRTRAAFVGRLAGQYRPEQLYGSSRDRCRRRARPNGWPPKRWARFCRPIKREFRSRIVIFDLPPMLLGDDVISILPRMDAALLVAGVGSTSVSDIKECQKHLQRTPVVRVVVNKATETAGSYYGYY